MTNEKNIEQLFSNEQSRLTGYVKQRIGSAEDAEDIVQDVFLSMTGAFDDISDLRKSISWLYATSKHKIVDFLRKKKTYSLEDQKKQYEDDEALSLADILPSFEILPDEQLMQELIWDEIQLCLGELPQEQRQVFEWHEFEGLSFKQIAEMTGETVNTLISRKRYAVVYLRTELEDLFNSIKE